MENDNAPEFLIKMVEDMLESERACQCDLHQAGRLTEEELNALRIVFLTNYPVFLLAQVIITRAIAISDDLKIDFIRILGISIKEVQQASQEIAELAFKNLSRH